MARSSSATDHDGERRGRRPRFADRSVRTKILAAIGTLTFVAVGSGALAVSSMQTTTEAVRSVADAQSGLASELAFVRAEVNEARLAMAQVVAASSDQQRQMWASHIADIDAQLEEAIGRVDVAVGADFPQWTSFVDMWREWQQVRESQLMAPAMADDAVRYEQVRLTVAQPLMDRALEHLDDAAAQMNAYVEGVATDAEQDANRAVAVFVVALALGVLVAVLVALRVTAQISRPVREVGVALQALAEGDLTAPVTVTGADEIGRMAGALREAQTSLRGIVSQVAETSSALAAAAEQMSAAGTQVSASAEESSSQAGAVAAAAEEVSRNVQAVATGAEQMGSSIREIAQNANDAAQVAARAVEFTRHTQGSVSELGASAREIGDVVKVITSIAEQTNLLALNATIEAARAGEAGKGFAVVAGEVKDLAQESARAAEDIAGRIATNQTQTQTAVAAIGEISSIIATINDYQLTIASAVEEQTATTGEMSRGVGEAATGSGEIAQNITGVAAATATSSEVLTQLGASIDELARMSADLRGKVSTFTY
ncbi:methyl-accepting chemotaxis protein [Cellulomonas bogoriensis]|uniref:Chemotaxis protein n=1 Tax=Cellulomonas bogoriensis 69B4 = DSM 16987 TaxID=1386082 RepID=A0A0A0BSE1_9CELL|nr:methyl-accepting chemotaxis protein [Cellulomonas bogoriensis]KGM11358.1 chemotaxis protein [Cellulomonas bogoriensis 69B4 = DSM 16987]